MAELTIDYLESLERKINHMTIRMAELERMNLDREEDIRFIEANIRNISDEVYRNAR